MDTDTTTPTGRPWSDITPADATDLRLPAEGITGPLGEDGQPCPWPWEPQQLTDAALGMYHCPHCGSMVLAGVAHPDYRDEDPA